MDLGVPRKLELDGLRALAVMGVLYSHLWDESSPLGHIGVRLFFVLSGFLITGILVRDRDAEHTHVGRVLAVFYARRALRIWPAYYALIFALALANAVDFRSSFIWHALFLSNFWFVIQNDWVPWVVAHLWSLSIEEQFYLAWPLIILLAPPATVRPLCWILIAAGPIWRGGVVAAGGTPMAAELLPPGSFDALAAGSLLALPHARRLFAPSIVTLAGVGATLVSIWLLVAPPPGLPTFLADLDLDSLLLLPLVLLIKHAATGIGSWPGVILRSFPVAGLGRISYGVYLYHVPVMLVLIKYFNSLGIDDFGSGPLFFLLGVPASILVAIGSWFVIERPMNAYKSRIGQTSPHLAAIQGSDAAVDSSRASQAQDVTRV